MKVAIYTRVSTSMQMESGDSLEAQKSLLTEYSKLKQLDIYDLYTDQGISAKDTNRAGFQQMLHDAKENKFDAILVWKLSRFSRSLKDLLNIAHELEKHNVTIISYAENIDMSTPSGKFMFNMIGSFSEFERETISENMKMAVRQAVYKGHRNISHCYGYKVIDKKFVIIDSEADTVNLLFDYYIKCQNIAEVERYAQQLQLKARRGNIFCYNSIAIILRNVAYAGYCSYKGFIPYKKRIIPRIVDDKKFDKVQKILITKCPGLARTGKVKTIKQWLSSNEI